ncbi:MAG TPA: ABC transporter ATP-binding protein [Gemmatimonadaceae bacterium]|nr:ABC transporter ATP-binding protein [Gemmatimonadaceae bacterium]
MNSPSESPAPRGTVIEVERLAKSYRRGVAITEVLKDVSFTIRRGEFVAVMGPSGCGKSTLLNLLGFLDRPDGGTYRFEGADLSGADDATLSAVRNRRIGFVFQQFHLLDRVTALDNVTLPLLYADDDADDAAGGGAARARRSLAMVGLENREDHFPAELSGGEQQRVAVARALINDPAMILADEPTGNLDAKSGNGILDLLRTLADQGRTIVLVTHDRAVANRADRTLVIEDGRVVAGESAP